VALQIGISMAASLSQNSVVAALRVMNATTFFGPIAFDSKGKNYAKPIFSTQVKGTEIEVIAPANQKTANLVYPIPWPVATSASSISPASTGTIPQSTTSTATAIVITTRSKTTSVSSTTLSSTTNPSSGALASSSGTWKPTAIGVGVGAGVILVAAIIGLLIFYRISSRKRFAMMSEDPKSVEMTEARQELP